MPIFLDIDDCESSPCKNGATCIDGIASRTCVCVRGYTGEDCEIDEDNCNPNPCNNGGSCIDGVDSYKCHCAGEWIGDVCDESKHKYLNQGSNWGYDIS